MERNIRRLLLTLLVFFVLPSAPPSGAVKNYFRKISVIRHVSTWDRAAQDCNENADGLLTIRNQKEAKAIVKLGGWIGLRKYSNNWTWSEGKEDAKFLVWDDGEPIDGRKCVWKLKGRVGWKSAFCDVSEYYLCMKYAGILVQEKKTWEEALVHCRELYGDLVSLPEQGRIRLLDREALRQDADTDEVWVGLRFLAGEWLWMSGHKAQSDSLPQCPAHHLHCGAIAHNDTKWKILDCSEKRNFLCINKKT